MKALYWRPRRMSRPALLIIAALAVAGVAVTERCPVVERQGYYAEKLEAAHLADRALAVLKDERLKRGIPIDPDSDPAATGVIGQLLSSVTSHSGDLPAKQTSANPNFAAVIVELMKRAGVAEGDSVALGLTGSFPALNVAVCAAVQTLKARPIAISTASASQWGANFPELMWPTMERLLVERQVLQSRSIAATRGGIEDRGLGMAREGRKLLDEEIAKNGLRPLAPRSFQESVDARMRIYEEAAAGAPIKLYINIGGGTSSVGRRAGKRLFAPGLNLNPPRATVPVDSVMSRFAGRGVPVIHLVRVAELAERYGLPLQPKTRPKVGDGAVFVRREYNRPLAAGVLIALVAVMLALSRTQLALRVLLAKSGAPADPGTGAGP
ncbi:MAG: poly-gamma-glutamate system protein [Deltaproteobacteria bacterium]|nr:poly-gamma-glutamate system protein [Deltaproteobacteria bacterium]